MNNNSIQCSICDRIFFIPVIFSYGPMFSMWPFSPHFTSGTFSLLTSFLPLVLSQCVVFCTTFPLYTHSFQSPCQTVTFSKSSNLNFFPFFNLFAAFLFVLWYSAVPDRKVLKDKIYSKFMSTFCFKQKAGIFRTQPRYCTFSLLSSSVESGGFSLFPSPFWGSVVQTYLELLAHERMYFVIPSNRTLAPRNIRQNAEFNTDVILFITHQAIWIDPIKNF